MRLKYQQPHSIKLENRFYYNDCLVKHLIEKEHQRQKYIALREYKDTLKKDLMFNM